MITVYFPDGTYRRVTAVEGDLLVKQGQASYTPYDVAATTIPDAYDTATVVVPDEPAEEMPEPIEPIVTESPEDLDPEPNDNPRW